MNRAGVEKNAPLIVFVTMALFLAGGKSHGEPVMKVPSEARCPVCGMFVAKYPGWIVQVRHGSPPAARLFDGVKDMMTFYFSPERFGSSPSAEIGEIWVKDYYTLEWLDGRQAFYAVGSDVYGPMGHELIPFNSRVAAESFMKDHRAREILTFDQITRELVDSMTLGQKMR